MGAVKLGMFICLFVTFDACLLNKCGKYLIFSPIDAQLLGLMLYYPEKHNFIDTNKTLSKRFQLENKT